MVRKTALYFVSLVSSAGLWGAALAQDAGDLPGGSDWPQQIELDDATVILYQPQAEKFEGDIVEARMATSIERAGADEPTFGAVWFRALVETDRAERTVRLISLETVRTHFPGATAAEEQAFSDMLKREMPKLDLVGSLDGLLASIDAVDRADLAADGISTDPPKIIYSDRPAILVTVDGAPILERIDGGPLMAVVNTPFPMVYRPSERMYYLMADNGWYRAAEIEGEWRLASNPPSEIARLRPDDLNDPDAPRIDGSTSKIIGTTAPTELIATDGVPRYGTIAKTNLLYVANSEDNIVYDTRTRDHYVLLSGRWYASKSLNGPWRYVAADEVPADFADIPAESPIGEVRASIAGTEEAREAILDAYVPQTASIVRSEAKLEVEYDGIPEFVRIQGTSIRYAVNTETPVIEVDGRYYAVDNGVWFIAPIPSGPWAVADSVPAQVYDIPPSAPVYNIKYVYIYDSTPDVVYVGYTPGYIGNYIYRDTVVYGTGYYYRPWYRTYYYPRFPTWGFGFQYSPFYGWTFGLSYSAGPFALSIGFGWGHYHRRHHHHRYGWWGPTHYRPPHYHRPHHRPLRYRPPYYRQPDYRRYPREFHLGRPWRGDLYERRDDRAEYRWRRDRRERDRTVDRDRRREDGRQRPRRTHRAERPNDVFVDREGNVYRRDKEGWQRREGRTWRRTEPPEARTERREWRQEYRGTERETRRDRRKAAPETLRERREREAFRQRREPSPEIRTERRRERQERETWDRRRSRLERDYQSRERGAQRSREFERSRRDSEDRGSQSRRGTRRERDDNERTRER